MLGNRGHGIQGNFCVTSQGLVSEPSNRYGYPGRKQEGDGGYKIFLGPPSRIRSSIGPGASDLCAI